MNPQIVVSLINAEGEIAEQFRFYRDNEPKRKQSELYAYSWLGMNPRHMVCFENFHREAHENINLK